METQAAAEFFLLFNVSTIAAVCFRWGMDETIVRRVAAAGENERQPLGQKLVALSHRRVLSWTMVATIPTAALLSPPISSLLLGLKAEEVLITVATSMLIALVACAARVHQGAGRTNMATFLLNICIPLFSLFGFLFCLVMGFQPDATGLISIYAMVAMFTYLCVVSRAHGSPYALLLACNSASATYDAFRERRAANKLGGVVLAQQALLWGSYLIIPLSYDDTIYKGFIVAQKVATLISLLMLAINFTFSARFASLHTGRKHQELRELIGLSCFAIIAGSAIFAVLVIYFHELVFSFANIGSGMAPTLFILLAGQVFFSLASLFAIVLSMCHDEDFLLVAQGSINACGFLLFLIVSIIAPIEITCAVFIVSYLVLSIVLGLRVFSITSLRASKPT